VVRAITSSRSFRRTAPSEEVQCCKLDISFLSLLENVRQAAGLSSAFDKLGDLLRQRQAFRLIEACLYLAARETETLAPVVAEINPVRSRFA
jgi:hypothetical protein